MKAFYCYFMFFIVGLKFGTLRAELNNTLNAPVSALLNNTSTSHAPEPSKASPATVNTSPLDDVSSTSQDVSSPTMSTAERNIYTTTKKNMSSSTLGQFTSSHEDKPSNTQNMSTPTIEDMSSPTLVMFSSSKEDLLSPTKEMTTSSIEDLPPSTQDTLVFQDTPQETSPSTQEKSGVPDDKAVAKFKRMLNMLQRAGAALPELGDGLMRGQPLTKAQRQDLAEFAREFGTTLASLPDLLQTINSTADVLKLLVDSGLLDRLNIGNSLSSPIDPQPHTVHWLKCRADLVIMANALGSGQMWALQMLDSWGKPEASVMRGNLFFAGNNEECTKVHHVNKATFAEVQGKICRMSIFLESLQTPLFGAKPLPLSIDTCLPKSCETLDLNSALIEGGFSNISMTCTADLDIGDDPAAIVAIIVLSVFLALMMAGTLTEFCITPTIRTRQDFINAFVSNSSNTDLLNSGVNGTTLNGKLGKHEFINGAFELSEVGFISTGNGIKLQPSNGNSNGAAKEAGPNMVTTELETKLDNNTGLGNGGLRMLNGDYTDDLPRYNAHASGIKNNGHRLDPYAISSHLLRTSDQSSASRLANDVLKQGGSPKSDDSAHLPNWQRALLAFSLPRNAGKILGVKASSGSIACLHGIRVLSLGWVIFGHVLGFSGQAGFYQNPLDMFELEQDFTFQVMLNGTLSVDSFFFMSGLLTAYMFLKECGKQEKVTIKQTIMYYVHRYWRLTPPVLIWVMVVACLVQYVGEGRPAWVDYPPAQMCRDNWWVNLFYIENLYEDKPACLGVTWYLANDMQFYFLAPLVVIPWIYRKQVLGFILASSLILTHLISNAWLVYEYNFDLFRPEGGYMPKLYIKPWARVGPFAIGLIMGYILWKTKCKMHINKYIVAIGWIISMGAMLTITLITYDENKNILTDPTGWPMAGRLVHETLSRPVWALVLAWIVLACSTGHGGFINSILSWEGFLPLSRMTYCAYLVHMTVMSYEFSIPVSSTLYTMSNLIYLSFGMYIMSYAVAFLLAVAVEAPMLGLEKVMLSR